MVWMVRAEAIPQVVCLACAEYESWANSQRRWANASNLDGRLLEPGLDAVGSHGSLGIKPEESSIATHILDEAVSVTLHVAQFNF